MNRKALALALTLMLGVGTLSACGNTDTAATASPSQGLTSPSPAATDETADSRGITGSYYSDITVGLEKFGLTDHSFVAAPDEAKDFYAHSSTAACENSDFDAALDYSLSIDNDHQVISSSFGATWLYNDSNDTFIAGAELYLGFAATMPYDAADDTAAKDWVAENIQLVTDGESVSTTIGDAKFELYGTTTADGEYNSFWLDISKSL